MRRVAELVELLNGAAALVFPSLWEGTPLTAFEALAAGKPIVATDADGLLDILRHDFDARIVLPRAVDRTEVRVPLFVRPDTRRAARA